MKLYEFLKTAPKEAVAVELLDIISSMLCSHFITILSEDDTTRRMFREKMSDRRYQQMALSCCFAMLDEKVEMRKHKEIRDDLFLQMWVAEAMQAAKNATKEEAANNE